MNRRWFFAFFFISGFCGLVYEVVWLRLCMASFGVNAPTISTVLSVFMAGLGLGSLAAGKFAERYRRRSDRIFLRYYGACELLIAVSGFAVPAMLVLGESSFRTSWSGVSWGSAGHYLFAGGWIALALLPWCFFMGATIPLAMAAIRRRFAGESATSFSYLYLANVAGATAGTAVSAFFLIELLGLRGTLRVAAALNLLLGATALWLSGSLRPRYLSRNRPPAADVPSPGARPLVTLFSTGFLGMAAQVAWVRLYMPYVGTTVYAFAGILAVYLAAGAAGTQAYRRWGRGDASRRGGWALWLLTAGMGLLPLWSAIPGMLHRPIPALGLLLVLVGTTPFAAVLGFLTPMLVDRWSGGDPDRAGAAYAVNVLGSILGPLAAGFVLLPHLGARASILLLFLWPLALCFLGGREPRRPLLAAAAALFLALTAWLRGGDGLPKEAFVLRDYEGTVTAMENDGYGVLTVNGTGMTLRTPITKYMAHLPLALLDHAPKKTLAIAFGIGTTFRSLASWDIPVTAVELVPSVPEFFGRFHADAASILANPANRVVIDDGRRFLTRTREKFDVIAIDPPPPVEAAGSSMLYSVEFLKLAEKSLAENGILQHWMPAAPGTPTGVSIAKALKTVFPFVRAFDTGFGTLFTASRDPLPERSAGELAARLPPAAQRDLVEWYRGRSAEDAFKLLLEREIWMEDLVRLDVPVMRDDRPFNEYFLLRAPGLALRAM